MTAAGRQIALFIPLAASAVVLSLYLSSQALLSGNTPIPAVETETSVPDSEPTEDTRVANAAGQPPLGDFSELVSRPLFTRNRRPPVFKPVTQDPPEEAPAPIPQQAIEKNQFTVMGIFITEDEKIALLKPASRTGDVIRVREGQNVAGWTVESIEAGFVTILQGGVKDVVKLSDNKLSEAEKRRLAHQAKKAKQPPRQTIAERRAAARRQRAAQRPAQARRRPASRRVPQRTPDPRVSQKRTAPR